MIFEGLDVTIDPAYREWYERQSHGCAFIIKLHETARVEAVYAVQDYGQVAHIRQRHCMAWAVPTRFLTPTAEPPFARYLREAGWTAEAV